jgi:hypothetical protein
MGLQDIADEMKSKASRSKDNAALIGIVIFLIVSVVSLLIGFIALLWKPFRKASPKSKIVAVPAILFLVYGCVWLVLFWTGDMSFKDLYPERDMGGNFVSIEAKGGANVRKAPDKKAPVLFTETNGHRFVFLDSLPQWFKVETRQGVGYVHQSIARFVQIEPDEPLSWTQKLAIALQMDWRLQLSIGGVLYVLAYALTKSKPVQRARS